jgi:hypothetical protein
MFAMMDFGNEDAAFARVTLLSRDAVAGAESFAAAGSTGEALTARTSTGEPAPVAAEVLLVAGLDAAGVTVWATGAVAEVDAAADDAAAGFTASGAGLGAASAAGMAAAARAGTAVPTEPAPDPLTAGSAAGDGRPATRGGSKLSGSTYPCGSLVVRAPKYT